MNCPKCNNKAISLSKWLSGIGAFKTTCNSCGITLKANWLVYFLFVLTVAVAVSLIPLVSELLAYLELEASKLIRILALLPIVFLGGIAAWWLGSYKPA